MKISIKTLCLTTMLAWNGISTGHAATVTLTASDAFGASSFNSGLNWSDTTAPTAGNDYVLNDFRMRTPADGNSHTFGGDSLTVNSTNGANGGLMYKGTGNTGVITVANLILAGGWLHHQNGVGDLWQLDGNINVTADSTIWAKQGNINVLADLGGSGNISIPQSDAFAEDNRYVNFIGSNTGYTGNIDATGRFRLSDGGGLTFSIGTNGTNNSVSGAGIAVFDGVFRFDLSGASNTLGDSWAVASVATQSFGETFSVEGFAESNDVWTTGVYQFDEGTGVLSVVPEPGSVLLAAIGTMLCALRGRRALL